MTGRGTARTTTTGGQAPPPEPPPPEWDRSLEAVLEDWRMRAWASQTAHYRIATKLRLRHRMLGLPVVIFTTAVGTSIFATLNESTATLELWPRVVVGTISIGAAVLAGIQTFFGFAQRADQHVLAGDWYSAIRRKIEQMLATPRQWRGDPRDALENVRKEMNHVGSQFPEIGEKTWREVAREFGIDEPPTRAKPAGEAASPAVVIPEP